MKDESDETRGPIAGVGGDRLRSCCFERSTVRGHEYMTHGQAARATSVGHLRMWREDRLRSCLSDGVPSEVASTRHTGEPPLPLQSKKVHLTVL